MARRPLQEIIEEFVDSIRVASEDTATYFSLTVTVDSHEITTVNTTPEQLKARGISMRNLKGEFIK